MYSISPGQIKAARGLLDWTRDELALASCVSSKTVAKLENGEKISLARVIDIRKSLEQRGVEFVGNRGVVLNTNEAKRYSGPEGTEQFYEDMLLTAKETGGEIIAIFKTSEQFADALGVANYSNLERLTNLRKYAEVKCLLTDARNASLVVSGIQMRATANPPVGIWSTLQCGNKHALIFMNSKNEYWYYVVTSTDIALNEEKHFLALWNTALPLALQSKA
jgi:transcriptional regulator with XRE-family HTH domain